jgi:ABC-type sugar transport system substrate-binding protein
MDSEHKAGIGKRLNLPRGRRLVVAVVVSVACLGAAGAAVAASSPSWTVPLHHGGTFKLAPSIVAKIKAHKPINYVFSYGSCSIQGFSQQYEAGYNASLPVANKIYPIKGTRLCPPQTQQNVTQQISQIDALLNTGQIDCLSIEPQDSTSMASVVQQALAKGIPTFTVGLTTFGNELTNFTQVPQKEGATAAKTVLTYMKAHKLHFKTFAVSGGDPTQYWAVQRAKGFRLAIQKAIPGAKFVTTEKNMLNTTYTPGTTYDTYKAFLTGAGKNVQVIENVEPRPEGEGVQPRLERHPRPGRRYQGRYGDRAVRSELAAAGRVRSSRLRPVHEDRQGVPEHPGRARHQQGQPEHRSRSAGQLHEIRPHGPD